MGCEHPEIVYEVRTRTHRPYLWTLHALRCTWCEEEAVLVAREKITRKAT